jgi:hypothetical protein
MSTVADIMDELQDRIPKERIGSLFPALNRAIGLLAKRLYILESDLIIDDLSINIFAQISYEASTIAFVDGKSETEDTITDSDSQFVAEGFKEDMPITTDCSGNAGPFRISTVAAGTLTLHPSASLTAQAAGSSYTLTSANHFGYVPSDFWGIVGKPAISGYKDPLLPLPDMETKLQYMSSSGMNTGTPLYYELKGNKFCITPATASDITIIGDYFKKPATMTNMNSILPFEGVLDDAITEYLLNVLAGGTATAETNLQSILTDAVDLIVAKRAKRAGGELPVGIPWGSLY